MRIFFAALLSCFFETHLLYSQNCDQSMVKYHDVFKSKTTYVAKRPQDKNGSGFQGALVSHKLFKSYWISLAFSSEAITKDSLGSIILFDDGSRFVNDKAKITVSKIKPKDKETWYSVKYKVTEEQLKKIETMKILGYQLAGVNNTVQSEEQSQIMGIARCILSVQVQSAENVGPFDSVDKNPFLQ